jgi:hypothetical protein
LDYEVSLDVVEEAVVVVFHLAQPVERGRREG